MTTLAQSEAYFTRRLVEIGVAQDMRDALEAQGFKTMARLAHCISANPGVADDAKFVEFLRTILDKDVPESTKAAMRQALGEAQATIISELRTRYDPQCQEQPRALPRDELNARIESQQKRLAGIELTGEYLPSNGLMNLAANMKETGEIIYIPPSKCLSRQAELSGEKKEATLSIQNGKLTVKDKLDIGTQEIDGEPRLRYALTRRALVLDMFNIIDYHTHNRWMEFLLGQLSQKNRNLTVSLPQIIEADRLLWMRIAELVRGGLGPDSSGTLPVATAMAEARQDPQVIFALYPAFAKSTSTSSPATSSMKPAASSKKRPQPKAKNESKRPRYSVRMPSMLTGLSPNTPSGEPICFGFNLGDCKQSVSGGRCSKGLHICMKCGSKEHGSQSCSKR